jgi:hypothetical protein
MKALATEAETVRESRTPAAKDNPFLKAQETVSESIVNVLDKWRDTQEALSESLFLSIYGSPALQAAVGIDPASPRPACKAAKNPMHRRLLEMKIAELTARTPGGRRHRPEREPIATA